MPLVLDNCLIGKSDEIPGVSGSKLPSMIDDKDAQWKLVKIRTVYAHNIRISSMNEVE
jgi:hypothetical protein